MKRGFCSECGEYVVLSQEGECPAGHARPSLRGIEEWEPSEKRDDCATASLAGRLTQLTTVALDWWRLAPNLERTTAVLGLLVVLLIPAVIALPTFARALQKSGTPNAAVAPSVDLNGENQPASTKDQPVYSTPSSGLGNASGRPVEDPGDGRGNASYAPADSQLRMNPTTGKAEWTSADSQLRMNPATGKAEWTSPADPQLRMNPTTGKSERTSADAQLRMNPTTGKSEWASPDSQLRMNPTTGKSEWTP